MNQPADRPAAWPAVSMQQARDLLTRAGSPFEMEEKTIDGRQVRVWKHAPANLRDEVVAARALHGPKPFLIHEDERVDFEAFHRACAAFARRLIADGIQPGDRVAVVMRNLPEWPVAFYGAIMAGAIVAPLNAWWTGAETQFGLADCGAKAAVFDGDRYDRFSARRGDCPDLALVYTTRHAGADGGARLEDILGRPGDWSALPDAALPDIPLETDGDAVIFYTSGTSGKPKGALATHRMVTSNVMAASYAVARRYVRAGLPLPTPGEGPQKGYIAGIPFFHVTGFCALLQVCVTMGYKMAIMRKWDTVEAFRVIERERLTNCGGVPTLAWQMIQHPRRHEFDLSSLELVTYGGAAAAPEIVPQLRQAFPAALSGLGWGMTETCATFTMNGGEDYDHRPASSGAPVAVGDIRIVDMNTLQDLPVGEVGELWAKGPNVVKGYWNNPEATAEAIVQDGWLRSGDLARVDEEGFLYVVDRAKDMIIRGGENIYCIEVENALFDHPAVADAALVSMPHKTLGEEPGAVVVLKDGAAATASELKAFVAERLASFKVPVKILFSVEPLPRNANGKVVKPMLRDMLMGS